MSQPPAVSQEPPAGPAPDVSKQPPASPVPPARRAPEEPLSAAPLRAVDTVQAVSDTEVLASKQIRPDDPYLAGHYPGFPIYPGVFVLESLRQAVQTARSSAARLVEVGELRLIAPLLPGATVTLSAVCTQDGNAVTASARCHDATGRMVAQVTAGFVLIGNSAGPGEKAQPKQEVTGA